MNEELTRKLVMESQTPEELTLLLLNYGKVSGKIMMQYQCFPADKEIFSSNTILFEWQRGPYSQVIANSIVKLISEGKICKFNRGEGHATYAITETGVKYVKEVIKSKHIINKSLENLRNAKCGWDEWNKKAILMYVARNYPEYASPWVWE